MQAWIPKAVILAAAVAMIVIRAPHGHRSRTVRVARSHAGPGERVLLIVAWVGFLLPFVWVAAPALAFADFAPRAGLFTVGAVMLLAGLGLLHRAHVDLGTNWSVTLEVREHHTLVTSGVYRRVRHPMYLALLLYGLGQVLVVPNWVVGPASLLSILMLLAFRVPAEERMMLEHFGDRYATYAARTSRLLPGVW